MLHSKPWLAFHERPQVSQYLGTIQPPAWDAAAYLSLSWWDRNASILQRQSAAVTELAELALQSSELGCTSYTLYTTELQQLLQQPQLTSGRTITSAQQESPAERTLCSQAWERNEECTNWKVQSTCGRTQNSIQLFCTVTLYPFGPPSCYIPLLKCKMWVCLFSYNADRQTGTQRKASF